MSLAASSLASCFPEADPSFKFSQLPRRWLSGQGPDRATFALLILCGLTSVSQAGDWPTYRHDNHRSGVTEETLSLPLAESWTFQPRHAPAPAWDLPHAEPVAGILELPRVRFDDANHVVAAGNAVFFGSSSDNKVCCLDAVSGQVRWTFFTGGPIRLSPTIWENKVYFGSDDGFAYCLNAADGHVVWQHRAGPGDQRLLGNGKMISLWPLRTGLLVEDGVAYFGAGLFPAEGTYLEAVRARDGATVWRNDALGEKNLGGKAENREINFSPQGYLLATTTNLFVPMGRATPAWFNRQDGALAGTAAFGKHIGGTFALISEGMFYTGTEEIIGMSTVRRAPGAWFEGRMVVLTPEVAYLAGDKEMMALDRVGHAKISARRFEAREEKQKLQGKIAKLRKEQELVTSNIELAQSALADVVRRMENVSQGGTNQTGNTASLHSGQAELQTSLKSNEDRLAVNGRALKELEEQAQAYDQDWKSDEAKAAVLWRLKCACPDALILAGNVLFAGGQDQIVAVDAKTGEQRWTGRIKGKVKGLAVAAGRLFASTDTGEIHSFVPGPVKKTLVASEISNPTPYPHDRFAPVFEAAAERIVKECSGTSASGGKLAANASSPLRGYCLIAGLENGRLAYELAKRTDLMIYAIEPDARKVAVARRMLDMAGIYGARVCVDQGSLSALPHSDYFANLIVSEHALVNGTLEGSAAELLRVLKPIGGTLMIGQPAEAKGVAPALPAPALQKWLAEGRLSEAKVSETGGLWANLTRGALPGAGKWTHQYAEPGNTACSDDQLVKCPLGLLWFGSPGPGEMIERHPRAAAPLSVNGIMFIQGEDLVMAYDAYNGIKLWERRMPGVGRSGVSQEASNLAADDQNFFVVEDDHCVRLEAATGKLMAIYHLPKAAEAGKQKWGYLAVVNGLLFGSSAQRERFCDQVFAIELTSGQTAWTHAGVNIPNTSISIGDGLVFVADKAGKREKADPAVEAWRKKMKLPAAGSSDTNPNYVVTALDTATGKAAWQLPVDLTGCVSGTHWSALATMYHNGALVIFGVYTDGHFWKEFFAGQFDSRRVLALSGRDGHELWSRSIGYRVRPLIIGDTLHAEPWCFKLATGEQIQRTNPITGNEEPWQFARPGHHCGCPSASPNCMFFRSYNIGYYDLLQDSGTVHFGSQRSGCWINSIFGNGLVMVPEASSGCMCAFPNMTTVVFKPRAQDHAWTRYSLEGETLPVKQLALNLGAPGDRRDDTGKLWLAYPRPLGSLVLPLGPDLSLYPGGTYFQSSADFTQVAGTTASWLYTFGVRGLKEMTIPLRRSQDGSARYTVRLAFAAMENEKPGQRVFDVQLQKQTVAENFDLARDAGGLLKACIKEFKNVEVQQDLAISLISRTRDPEQKEMPILQAVEIVRE